MLVLLPRILVVLGRRGFEVALCFFDEVGADAGEYGRDIRPGCGEVEDLHILRFLDFGSPVAVEGRGGD